MVIAPPWKRWEAQNHTAKKSNEKGTTHVEDWVFESNLEGGKKDIDVDSMIEDLFLRKNYWVSEENGCYEIVAVFYMPQVESLCENRTVWEWMEL